MMNEIDPAQLHDTSRLVGVQGSDRSSASRTADEAETRVGDAPTGTTTRSADALELSPTAELLARLAEPGTPRTDLVADISARIADGSYEQDLDARLDSALDAMLDDLEAT